MNRQNTVVGRRRWAYSRLHSPDDQWQTARADDRRERCGRLPYAVGRLPLLWLFALLPFVPACGYQVAGKATRIPPDVKTIAVPAFKNASTTFRIEQQITSAVMQEFVARTSYHIVAEPGQADAVLRGTVKDIRTRALTFDVNTGLATSLQVQVIADVKLEDVHSHKVLFSNNNYLFREEYQISETPAALFQEDTPALERLSHELARNLVTDILENF